MLTDCTQEDIALFSAYEFGGLANPVKAPVKKSYASLEESLRSTGSHGLYGGMESRFPQMLFATHGIEGRGVDVHLQWAAALDFHERHGHWPRPRSQKDAAALLDCARDVSERNRAFDTVELPTIWAQTFEDPDYVESFEPKWGVPRDLDAARASRFARLFGTELTGFCAYLGGAVAQEVIKKTGKFSPVEQWIHHEDHALITDDAPSNTGPPANSRYDDQVAILGKGKGKVPGRCPSSSVKSLFIPRNVPSGSRGHRHPRASEPKTLRSRLCPQPEPNQGPLVQASGSGPLLISPPALKRWGSPRRQG